MDNSWPDGLAQGTRILLSENGFSPDKIALVFLQHYIEHSDCGPEAEWKLMLIDSHGSHCTPQFLALANENHIRPFLIPHLIHCMQPLDVGVFQTYKHWHDMAIQDAFLEFDTEYTLPRFLGDLTKVRDHTFQKSTIQDAFKKAGMWPPDVAECIQQLKTFRPDTKDEPSTEEHSLPYPQFQPKTPLHIDPVRAEEFDSLVEGTKTICSEAVLDSIRSSIQQKRRENDLE